MEALDANDLAAAQAVFQRGKAMEERVVYDALSAYERGAVVQQIIGSSLARERQRFDRFLLYFGTVGNNAPLSVFWEQLLGLSCPLKS